MKATITKAELIVATFELLLAVGPQRHAFVIAAP
jgi:hypothetical protein